MEAKFASKLNIDGMPQDIQEATDDLTFIRHSRDLIKLYKLSDASGVLEINEVDGYPLKRDMLDTNVR